MTSCGHVSMSNGQQLDRRRPYIVLGYVEGGLKPETVTALGKTGFQQLIVKLETDDAYYNLLAEAWDTGETFMTVEQDIVPHRGALAELLLCPEPWCAYGYDYPPFGTYAGMGCAKFGWPLLNMLPNAMREIGTWADPKHPPKHWCRLDAWLKQYLYTHGAQQHVHGTVEHLHRGHPAHDCVTPEDLAAIAAEANRRG